MFNWFRRRNKHSFDEAVHILAKLILQSKRPLDPPEKILERTKALAVVMFEPLLKIRPMIDRRVLYTKLLEELQRQKPLPVVQRELDTMDFWWNRGEEGEEEEDTDAADNIHSRR